MPKIKSFTKVNPMIYAYNTPGVTYHDGWTKIGYTEKQTVKERIEQQTHTAGIQYKIAWQDNAMYKDGSGERFTDHDFHGYLETKKKVTREKGTEWFKTTGPESLMYFNAFAMRMDEDSQNETSTYTLRPKQAEAVRMTKEYFERGGKEFLWNAKPRFGKTITAYDLIRQMKMQNVLIVTNRPSVANSWADDFNEFIGWQTSLHFVSDNAALDKKEGVISRAEYTDKLMEYTDIDEPGMIAFESLQNIKGSVYMGGKFDKLKWVTSLPFDLLIVDESQEGISTTKTERAFDNINRKHTLYLSGTPFKQLASDQFTSEQIFNWSYADEQEAKQNWNSENANPYEEMPKMQMFTYQLSNMIYDKMKKASEMSDDELTVDFAFDLNEFFATNATGAFIHRDEIKKFLHTLTVNEKYPYSTPELRKEMSHTLWLLNRVASARALAKLLQEPGSGFEDYEIVLAAGDGKIDDADEIERSFEKVKKAIAEHDKTITLSVGQLTVGVTIPEWSGVLMLCNLESASSYIQAAFRAQNPYVYEENGVFYRKENSYVFDFDPARTLIVFDDYANNLLSKTVGGKGTTEDRKANIKRMLNFFPVIGEDDEGKMVELDEQQVLSIPRKIKSQDVVRKGFMSNFLFQNISGIFGAPTVVTEILKKIAPAHEEVRKKNDKTDDAKDIVVNKDGDVEVPTGVVIGKSQEVFGAKIYETVEEAVDQSLGELSVKYDEPVKTAEIDKLISDMTKAVTDTVKEHILKPALEEYDPKKNVQNRLTKEVENEVDSKLGKIADDYKQTVNIAQVEHDRKVNEATTKEEIKAADDALLSVFDDAFSTLQSGLQDVAKDIVKNKPTEVVEKLEKNKKEEEKKTVEDSIRDHLRGFSRTIPSFIMAYGDENLTLANFDDYTEDDVFLEVTSITEDEFRFLRDGGDVVNPETGLVEHYEGHLFDEVVFNDSIKEFLKIRSRLANYFDESQEDDIFDYIPPQKTNQIYTPKWVVKMMVDQLEEQNPGCFDDPTKTFADLYMKSGLYITEIVKRLYRSQEMKKHIPDDSERLHHILTKQVYGMAPTRIIYLIATNYILGFDEKWKNETTNFVQEDAAAAAKNGTLKELVDIAFDKEN